MKWRGRRGSSNVRVTGRGGGRGLAVGGGGGIAVIALFLGIWICTGNAPLGLLTGGGGGGAATPQAGPVQQTPEEEEATEFISVVLADTEEVWDELFRQQGRTYVDPTLNIFDQATQTGCGFADAGVGPFYCPQDQRVYLDLDFLTQLRRDLKAPGDFAVAYVIAHEVGHHVQRLEGTTTRVHQQRGRLSEREYNEQSVRLELQADYYAGVWAHHAQRKFDILEPGDIDEALGAASAVGDDRLQKRAQGRVNPDSFTHGTSEQRMRWFRKGFETGDPAGGDTFSASQL